MHRHRRPDAPHPPPLRRRPRRRRIASSPNASTTTSSSTPTASGSPSTPTAPSTTGEPTASEIVANPTADHPGTVNALDAPARAHRPATRPRRRPRTRPPANPAGTATPSTSATASKPSKPAATTPSNAPTPPDTAPPPTSTEGRGRYRRPAHRRMAGSAAIPVLVEVTGADSDIEPPPDPGCTASPYRRDCVTAVCRSSNASPTDRGAATGGGGHDTVSGRPDRPAVSRRWG